MKYAVTYSSKTGNTKLLAEAIYNVLPDNHNIYIGEPANVPDDAECIFVGFWTDKGTCDDNITAFLNKLENKKVFLFGTAGFGGEQSYFDRILKTVEDKLNPSIEIIGTYMCQGRMPASVRQRYEKMLEAPNPIPNLKAMIDNFDKALSHPDSDDIAALIDKIKKAL